MLNSTRAQPDLLDALEGIAKPEQLEKLRRFSAAPGHGFRIFIDETCEPDWRWSWAAQNRSATIKGYWASKYGAAGFLTHMLSRSGHATRNWRRANATIIPYFDWTVAGLNDWDSPSRATRLGCLQRLQRHSEAFQGLPPDRHFFLLTGERGPCCNCGRYKDVGFLNHRVITQSGDRGAIPIRLNFGGRWMGPTPPHALLPCYDARKDVNVPTPTLHLPAELSPLSSSQAPWNAPPAPAATARARTRLLFAAGKASDSACRASLLQHLGRNMGNNEVLVAASVPREQYALEMRTAKFCPICGGNAPWYADSGLEPHS